MKRCKHCDAGMLASQTLCHRCSFDEETGAVSNPALAAAVAARTNDADRPAEALIAPTEMATCARCRIVMLDSELDGHDCSSSHIRPHRKIDSEVNKKCTVCNKAYKVSDTIERCGCGHTLIDASKNEVAIQYVRDLAKDSTLIGLFGVFHVIFYIIRAILGVFIIGALFATLWTIGSATHVGIVGIVGAIGALTFVFIKNRNQF